MKFEETWQAMHQALQEIAEGKGRYSLDHLTHASNTIDDMKKLAVDALANSSHGLVGKTLELTEMPQDPRPVPVGTKGICLGVDGAGHLMMTWENGQSLNLIPGVDKYLIKED